jgi:hypothetical protein
MKEDEKSRTHRIYGRNEKSIQLLVGEPEGKKQRGTPNCIRKDNIKTDL